jgi:hypothetical protein
MLKALAAALASFSIAMLASLPGFASAQQPVLVFPPVEDADVDIDGMWSSASEWSMASETSINYTDGSRLTIRGMHDADFVYVMLEMPDDYIVDGHAGICFDSLSDGGPYLARDDYCYVIGTSFREYHGDGRTTLMQQAPLDQFVSAQRGLSDSNSPLFSTKGHMTYEFKVPRHSLGSANTQFGFYVSFDTRGQDNNYTFYYSWPDYKSAEYLRVASPRSWGIASLSADAEVPEFPVPVLGALAGVVATVVVLTRTRLLRI